MERSGVGKGVMDKCTRKMWQCLCVRATLDLSTYMLILQCGTYIAEDTRLLLDGDPY
jgi:hypothetical protein